MKNSHAKQDLLEDLLIEDDYRELQHFIILRNDTSGVSFLDYKSILIRELKLDSLCLELPKNICQNGHNLTLIFFQSPINTIFKKFPNIDNTKGLPIMGKVVEYSLSEDSVHIEVKFTQYKLTLWEEIIKKYEERQQRVSSLIQEVKK